MATSTVTNTRFSNVTANDHAGSIWIATLLCFVYSAITIFTRTYLRRGMYGLDDYLIFGAIAAHLGEMIAVIIGLKHGIGRTVSLISVDDVSKSSQALFSSQILYIASACLGKCSTLYLMMRLFNLNGPKSHNHGKPKLYHWLCMTILGIMGIWGVGSIVGLSVDCSVDNLIRSSARSQCSQQLLRWQVITAFDVATEAILILVAILIVLPVQLSKYLKFQVILAFSFRLPIIALSILRLNYVNQYTKSANPGLAQEPILVIQQVYLCWSIIAATIPNLKSFVRSFGSGFGIGIDMETYTNAYGSKNSHRNQYELNSVHNITNGSRNAGSRLGGSRHDQSFHGIEDTSDRLNSRTVTTHIRHDDGSIGSEGSQDHIIRKDVQYQIHYEDHAI